MVVLCEVGIGCGSCVGLCMEWGCDFIVVMFVIFKVGVVYVLLDLCYLVEWLLYMVCDVDVVGIFGYYVYVGLFVDVLLCYLLVEVL